MNDIKSLLANSIHPTDVLREYGYYFPPTDPTARATATTTDGYLASDFESPPAAQPKSSHRRGKNNKQPPKRFAVAIDCEMVGILPSDNPTSTPEERSEVARISAVDFLTGEVLLDTYIQPVGGRIKNWRSRWSGITPQIFSNARREGNLLRGGWRAARRALWRFAGEETILVGHALGNDLKVLRIVPGRVVDSSVIASEVSRGATRGDDGWGGHWMVGGGRTRRPGKRLIGLGALGRELLGVEVQREGPHCSLEDSQAARSVVRCCVAEPARLVAWAADEVLPVYHEPEEFRGEDPIPTGSSPDWGTNNNNTEDDNDEFPAWLDLRRLIPAGAQQQ